MVHAVESRAVSPRSRCGALRVQKGCKNSRQDMEDQFHAASSNRSARASFQAAL